MAASNASSVCCPGMCRLLADIDFAGYGGGDEGGAVFFELIDRRKDRPSELVNGPFLFTEVLANENLLSKRWFRDSRLPGSTNVKMGLDCAGGIGRVKALRYTGVQVVAQEQGVKFIRLPYNDQVYAVSVMKTLITTAVVPGCPVRTRTKSPISSCDLQRSSLLSAEMYTRSESRS